MFSDNISNEISYIRVFYFHWLVNLREAGDLEISMFLINFDWGMFVEESRKSGLVLVLGRSARLSPRLSEEGIHWMLTRFLMTCCVNTTAQWPVAIPPAG
jgi:hypothetical protein